MSQNQDKFIARLPDGMRDQLKKSAEQNSRSMNAELVEALKAYLDLEERSKSSVSRRNTTNSDIPATKSDVEMLSKKLDKLIVFSKPKI